MEDRWQTEAKAIYKPLQKELHTRVDAIATQFFVEDEDTAAQDADVLQDEIESIAHSEEYVQLTTALDIAARARSSAHLQIQHAITDEEREEAESKHAESKQAGEELRQKLSIIDSNIGLLCAKRDALQSGTVLTLDTFLSVLYAVDLSGNALSPA